MRRTILLLLASAPLLSGQFHSLVTTDDGGVLYFSTSLRIRGSDQQRWEKIYRWDARGLSLYAQRERTVAPSGSITNQFRFPAITISGDGNVVGLVTLADCIAGSSCFLGLPKYTTEVSGVSGQPIAAVGQGRLSRSGRYLATCCDGSEYSFPTLYDLKTGATRRISPTRPPMVSSTGLVLAGSGAGIYLDGFDGRRTVPTARTATQAVLDDRGATAFYTDGSVVARVDLDTGAENVVYRGTQITLAGVSNSGDRVAFLAAGQLLVTGADGTGLRLVSDEPGGIADAVLAGGGSVAYAVSDAGRILRYDLSTQTRTVVAGRTLTIDRPSMSAAAGSAYCVSGTGLSDATLSGAPPLPVEMGGLRLLLDGSPVPLLQAFPGKACFQVPWSTSAGIHTLVASAPSELPFEPVDSTSLGIVTVLPRFTGIIAHENFRGRVTADSPAHPGEVLHFYMTGLGPVDPPVADGEAAPSSRPARVVTAPVCRLLTLEPGDGLPVELLFAGLAPGLVGYYQVSIRLPWFVPLRGNGEALLFCSSDRDNGGADVYVPVASARRRGSAW